MVTVLQAHAFAYALGQLPITNCQLRLAVAKGHRQLSENPRCWI